MAFNCHKNKKNRKKPSREWYVYFYLIYCSNVVPIEEICQYRREQINRQQHNLISIYSNLMLKTSFKNITYV